MGRNSTRLWAEFTNFYTSAWIDLPFVAVRRMFGGRDNLSNAGWRAYDSWIGFMNEAVNELYSNRALGDAWGRGLEAAFTVRHMSGQFGLAAFDGSSSLTSASSPESSEVAISPAIGESRDGGRSTVAARERNSIAKAA